MNILKEMKIATIQKKLIDMVNEEIEVGYNDEMDSEGKFCYNDRNDVFEGMIFLDPHLLAGDVRRYVCVLAHEYGHYLNAKEDFGLDMVEFYAVNHEDVLYLEKAAWGYAYRVLKNMGWEEWDFFSREMIWALSSYVDDMSDKNKEAFLLHAKEVCLHGPEILDKPDLSNTYTA